MRIDMLAEAQLQVIELLRQAAGRGYSEEVKLWRSVWWKLDKLIKEVP